VLRAWPSITGPTDANNPPVFPPHTPSRFHGHPILQCPRSRAISRQVDRTDLDGLGEQRPTSNFLWPPAGGRRKEKRQRSRSCGSSQRYRFTGFHAKRRPKPNFEGRAFHFRLLGFFPVMPELANAAAGPCRSATLPRFPFQVFPALGNHDLHPGTARAAQHRSRPFRNLSNHHMNRAAQAAAIRSGDICGVSTLFAQERGAPDTGHADDHFRTNPPGFQLFE